MTVCKFFRQGYCRFGDGCRFEHPGSQRDSHNGGGFGGPQSSSQRVSQNKGRSPSRPSAAKNLPYALSADTIISDLTNERPQWILSAYGPGLKAPTQLFGGPLREQSFEEMRFLYYAAQASGDIALTMQQAQQGEAQALAQNQNAIQNVDDAIQYVLKAEHERPNRIDICNTSDMSSAEGTAINATSNPFNRVDSQPTPAANPFNQAGPHQSGTFGTPASLAQRTSPWAISTSGVAPMTGNTTSFPTDANNLPHLNTGSQQITSNPFNNFAGTANQTQFGGGAIQPTVPNSFGQTNPFPAVDPFGQSRQTSSTGGFGMGMQIAPSTSFGGNQSSSAAGADLGGFLAPTNSFGAAPTAMPYTNTTFDAPSFPGASNAFAATTTAHNLEVNGQTLTPMMTDASGIRAPSSMVTDTNSRNAFGAQTVSDALETSVSGVCKSMNGASQAAATKLSISHPALQSYASHGGDGQLSAFNGRRVQYKDGCPGSIGQDGVWEKIWFPEGPPAFNNKDTQVDEDAYDKRTVAAYENLRGTGIFVDGLMPLQPPKKEWCLWNF